MRIEFEVLQGQSGRGVSGLTNDIRDKRWDIYTMHYDRHSEVEFAATLPLPRLR